MAAVSDVSATGTSGLVALTRRAYALEIPLSAHLELTYSCPWQCVICYNPTPSRQTELSFEEWRQVIGELRVLGTLTVTLTGGEPLAHPRFMDIARAIREQHLALRILSNGSLVSETMAAEIAALEPLSVDLSLHGATDATHDRTTRRDGSFAAVLACIDRLQRHGVRMVLKSPVTRLNAAEIDGMIALAESLGIPLRLDATITPCDDGGMLPVAYQVDEETVRRVMLRVREHSAPPDQDQGSQPCPIRTAGSANCGIGRITLVVSPDGTVFPCMQWRSSALGNVRQQRLSRIWRESPVRREVAELAVAANDLMIRLGHTRIDPPYCLALAAQHTGDPLQPHPAFLQQARIADGHWDG